MICVVGLVSLTMILIPDPPPLQVVYVVVVLPYIILGVLLVRLLTLDGSFSAVIHFMQPNFAKLSDIKVSAFYFSIQKNRN